MLHRIVAVVLLTSLLAACGAATPSAPPAAATEVPAAVAPTEVPAVPAAPTEAAPTEAAPTAAAPNEAPTEAAASTPASATAPAQTPAQSAATNLQIFQIVPAESQVTYEVGETFLNQGNRYAVAVGNTQQISGEVRLDRADPRNSSVGPIAIDISAFQSDSERRDNAIRENWLESARFPVATFVPTQIEGLPASYTDGEELTLTISGDLTVRDVTSPVTFTVTGRIMGDEMTGVATTQLKMTDFGFDPPDIAGILRSEDDVRLTFSFVARPVA